MLYQCSQIIENLVLAVDGESAELTEYLGKVCLLLVEGILVGNYFLGRSLESGASVFFVNVVEALKGQRGGCP